MPGLVYMRDPSGQLVTVEEQDVQQALAAGASLAEKPEAPKDFIEQTNDVVTGATYGAMSGATFGLAEAGIVGNPDDPNIRAHRVKQLEQIQKAAPGSYGAGQVGTTLALGLLSGGGGVGGTIGAAAPEGALAALGNTVEHGVVQALTRSAGAEAPGILTRAAARGAAVGTGLAAEGAISGAAGAIKDAAFSGQELTAEKVLAGSFKGALIGATTGGLVGSGGTLLAPVVKKGIEVGGEFAARKLEDLADIKIGSAGNRKIFEGAMSAADVADDIKIARAETEAAMKAIEEKAVAGGLLPKVQAEGVEALTEAQVTAALEAGGQDTAAYEELARKAKALRAIDTTADVVRTGSKLKGLAESALGAAGTAAAVASGNFGALGALMGGKLAGHALRAIARANPDLVGRLAKGVRAWDDEIGEAAAALVSGESAKRSARGALREALRSRFDATKSTLESVRNPDMLIGRVAAQTLELSQQYPDLAGQVQQTMLQDYAYLQGLVPQGATRPTIGKPEEPTYTPAQMRTLVEAAEALDDPGSVISALARGEIPAAGLTALRERRPELMSQLEQAVLEQAAKLGEQMKFSRRMLLSLAFGFNGDWALKNVAAIQQSFAPEAAESEAAPQGGGSLPVQLGNSMLIEQPRGSQGGF